MATRAAINAFRRTYADPPGNMRRGAFTGYGSRYDMLWHYYVNSVFEDKGLWQWYKSQYGLYRQVRSIYNPTRRLVDFYAGVVYQGALAVDGKRLPDGTPLAIPLADDTPPPIKEAIGQLWQWSNWQTNQRIWVRYGAALGDGPVEIVDDVDGGKVTMEPRWPGTVVNLDLDNRGNVKLIVFEYDYEDDDGRTHTYRKEMDRDSLRTFRDNAPHGFDGLPPVVPNEYGFVPVVWCKHTDIGGDHGEPALRNMGKIDELNSLASSMVDQAQKVLNAPLFATGKNLRRWADSQVKRESTADRANPHEGREEINILVSDENGSLQAVNMPAGEALENLDRLIAEVERDHPEVVMYNKLREMTQVTGPAAERLFGDVRTYVDEARSNYDVQSVKLFQMALAIGGYRANRGDWGDALSAQQELFLPFDLGSYARGDLDFEIMPRPLIPAIGKTPDELRVAMEAGDRGFASWQWVSNEITGDAEAQRAQMQQEAASQPAQVPGTVDELTAAIQRNGTPNESAPENLDSTEGLNGIQIRAALELLEKVNRDELPAAIAVELLISLGIERERAQSMVDEAERFVAANPQPQGVSGD